MNGASEPRTRASLRDYLPWILRDYFTNQGPATALVVLLIAFMMLLPLFSVSGPLRASFGNVSAVVAVRLLRELAVPLAFLGTFFATNGIVANDRKLGYFRFLFAKPLRPPAYYATVFAVYGAGLLLVTLVLEAAWAVAVHPSFSAALLATVLILYVAYGGLGFLLSAAWRFDWLSLVSVLLVANFGWSMWGKSGSAWRVLLYLLPPVHRADDAYTLIGRDLHAAVHWGSIAWLLGYGVACFALGLVVIRRRPLGTS